jgi:hypothetical protein
MLRMATANFTIKPPMLLLWLYYHVVDGEKSKVKAYIHVTKRYYLLCLSRTWHVSFLQSAIFMHLLQVG